MSTDPKPVIDQTTGIVLDPGPMPEIVAKLLPKPLKASKPKSIPKTPEHIASAITAGTDPLAIGSLTEALSKIEQEREELTATRQFQVGLIPTYPPKEPPQPKRGRPSRFPEYSPETIQTLLTLTSEGYSLNRICLRDDMPAATTVRSWYYSGENPTFTESYARARDIGLLARAEMLRDEIATHHDPVRAKMLFEHDKWYLARMMPKRFGDHVTNDVNVSHEHHHVIDVSQLSPEALEKLGEALAALPNAPKVIDG